MIQLTKSNFLFAKLGLWAFLSLMIISCGSKQENELMSLKDLVPKDSVNQIKYIEEAIVAYNAIKASIANENKVGNSISRPLSDAITTGWDEKCGDTRAVFFSFGKILQSYSLIPDNLKPDAGIAVVFGKYPTFSSGVLHPDFVSANITLADYNALYSGRNAVVLKYVTGLNSTLSGTTIFETGNTQLIDDLGRPCPANCPNGTF